MQLHYCAVFIFISLLSTYTFADQCPSSIHCKQEGGDIKCTPTNDGIKVTMSQSPRPAKLGNYDYRGGFILHAPGSLACQYRPTGEETTGYDQFGFTQSAYETAGGAWTFDPPTGRWFCVTFNQPAKCPVRSVPKK